jgi:glycine/D-amino acid oxidase-like deaminating enzyme
MPAWRNEPAWNTTPWRELPALEGDAEADVCVIGLGGSGLAAITRLLELGLSVAGLDAGRVAGGAAGRNGGFLLAGTAAFHHDAVKRLGRETALHWYHATLRELDRMEQETPGLINRSGSLRIAGSSEELADCRLHLAALQADSLPGSWYEGQEGSGLLIPGDGTFNPLQRCRLLADRTLAAGAQLFENSTATQVSGNLVTTPLGTVRCKRVLVAVDGNLATVLPELAGRVRPLRLQMLAAAPTGALNVPRPVYARWGYEYWQQLADGSITLGGFRDRGGAAEWTSNSEPTPHVQQLLERFLREQLGVDTSVTHRWAATVGYTDQLLPVSGEIRDGVRAAGGYNGTGNLMGAILARQAAGMIGQELRAGKAVSAPFPNK